jgi:hypothetical protein
MTTTGGEIYLIKLSNLEKLEIQFVPESVPLGSKGDWYDVKVVGRNIPQHHYTGGSEGINLKLDFYADTKDIASVKRKCDWLRALRYSSGAQPPQKVRLVWGALFKREEWVVTQVNVEYRYFEREALYLPHQAYVDISLARDETKNPTSLTVSHR